MSGGVKLEPFKVHVPPIKVQTPKFRVGVLGVRFTVAPKHTAAGDVGNTTMPPVGITVIVKVDGVPVQVTPPNT